MIAILLMYCRNEISKKLKCGDVMYRGKKKGCK